MERNVHVSPDECLWAPKYGVFFPHKEHKDRKGLVNFVFFVAYMT